MTTLEADPMKMSEDERQCLSESRGGSANVISIFSYCARRYLLNPLVVFRLKNMTTPASKNTAVEFIKFSQNFCFIAPLVDFDQNCKYL